LLEEAVTDSRSELLVEGVVRCSWCVTLVAYFEEVSRIVFLLKEVENLFQTGCSLVNLILFGVVAEHHD
jgi:hypothetical protein